jgi:hypothetical protein
MGLTLAETESPGNPERTGPEIQPLLPPQEQPAEPASPLVQPTQPGPVAPAQPGTTRANPVPFGQPAVDERGMEIAVISVERNSHFDSLLPPQGGEFIVITLRLRNRGLTPDPLTYEAGANFQVVGERGIVYEMPVPVSTDNDLGAGQLPANGERTGKIVMEVGLGEQGLTLGWEAGGGPRWLSLQ